MLRWGKGSCRPRAAVDRGGQPRGIALLPWLLLGMGAISHLVQGHTPNPWIGGMGLLTFNSLYIYVAIRSFEKEKRDAVSTRVALGLLTLVTCALGMGYGGNWLLFFPLLGLATGAVVRMSVTVSPLITNAVGLT
ncbi:hypothetical protein AQJ91_37210 [Streptomyces dysideae]|uniref:Uncharacterized protein n=1 Tax=Streptomyces dysideae TaxID=909626 RepID=A0A101USV6_9ACTN|nr:hypothetical protein AQJ91_37210 [Streptomyces dysideae]